MMGNGPVRLITGSGQSVCAGTANRARSRCWKINLCPLLIQHSLINCERSDSGDGIETRMYKGGGGGGELWFELKMSPTGSRSEHLFPRLVALFCETGTFRRWGLAGREATWGVFSQGTV